MAGYEWRSDNVMVLGQGDAIQASLADATEIVKRQFSILALMGHRFYPELVFRSQGRNRAQVSLAFTPNQMDPELNLDNIANLDLALIWVCLFPYVHCPEDIDEVQCWADTYIRDFETWQVETEALVCHKVTPMASTFTQYPYTRHEGGIEWREPTTVDSRDIMGTYVEMFTRVNDERIRLDPKQHYKIERAFDMLSDRTGCPAIWIG